MRRESRLVGIVGLGIIHGAMPILMLILTCALWGLSFPLMRALHLEQSARVPGVSTWFLALWLQCVRFGLGAILLAPWVLRRYGINGQEVRQGLLLAFWGGIGMWLQADALAYTDASVSAFLTQGYCVIIPLWVICRNRSWPSGYLVVAIVLVVVGSMLLSGMSLDRLRIGRGEWETLLAAVFFSFQILTLENPRFVKNRGMPVTLVMFTGITLLFLPVVLIAAPEISICWKAAASWSASGIVLALSLLCSVGAYSLMNIWQPRVSATEAGLIYTIEPLYTALYVLFLPRWLGTITGVDYPNEVWTGVFVGGALMILAANGIVQWKKPGAKGLEIGD